MKKWILFILLIGFIFTLSACDLETEEKIDDGTEEERTYNGIVYEEAYYYSGKIHSRTTNAHLTSYTIINEEEKRMVMYLIHSASFKGSSSSKSASSCEIFEGTYVEDDNKRNSYDYILTDKRGEEHYLSVKEELKERISVKKAIEEIKKCTEPLNE